MQEASRACSAVSDVQSSFMDVNPFFNNLQDWEKNLRIHTHLHKFCSENRHEECLFFKNKNSRMLFWNKETELI